MGDFLGSIWWMIVSLGVLVTFHEFGHYWVARRCGVRVLRFSVGFGKPLWSRRDRHGTEFAIAAIPLGGYVKMLDERETEVAPEEAASAFNRKTVWQRIAIVAAGPIANLILCVALLWTMFVIGKQDYSPTLGAAEGMAAEAGLRAGDRLQAIDGRTIATWGDAAMVLTGAALDGHDAQIRVQDATGAQRELRLPLSQLPVGFDERRVPVLAGLVWQFQAVPPLIERVVEDSPAVGILRPGDRILAVDGQRVTSAGQVTPLIQSVGEHGYPAMVEVDREGQRMALEMRPQLTQDPERGSYWALGVAFAMPAEPAYDASLRYGPLAAIPVAFRETGRLAADSLSMMRRMVTGRASVDNIAGPVTIARAANASAKRGVDWFLWFLALISLSLAIINLLPIPILDGGHLLYYLIELVKGSPVSERAMAAGQYVGLAMLAGLMGLAFYNDILDLVSR